MHQMTWHTYTQLQLVLERESYKGRQNKGQRFSRRTLDKNFLSKPILVSVVLKFREKRLMDKLQFNKLHINLFSNKMEMGEVQANTKPFLLVRTRHWAVAQRWGQREKPQSWRTDLAAPSAVILRHRRSGCAHLCTHKTLSGVTRTIGGTQRAPRGEQWQGVSDTPMCLCYTTRASQSQRKIHLLNTGKKWGFFTTVSILFLKGMLRKTALYQMSSISSCREFIKRRELYE